MATPQMITPPKEDLYRMEEMVVPVQTVQEGDLVFALAVVHSEPYSDYIWTLEANDAQNDQPAEAGLILRITTGHPITIQRKVPLRENQCIDCGRDGVKYAARHQCNACYQREYRAQRAG